MTEVKIFLASSNELITEREAFERELSRRSEDWQKNRGIKLTLVTWEKMSDRVSIPRKQDDYNKYLRSCEIVVTLCWHKAGTYTEEEFDNAYRQLIDNKRSANFIRRGKPYIHVYFKKIPESDSAEESLKTFRKKINELGHFETYFLDSNDLWNKFYDELEKDIPPKSFRSSIWVGILGFVLACLLGLYYYQNILGKPIDLKGQRYAMGGLFLFGVSIGALLFGAMAAVRKITKRYFLSELTLATTGTIITLLIGWFMFIPPVTIFHLSGKVLDNTQKTIPEVELNVEGTDMLTFSDSEGNYRFTFLNYSKASSYSIVTSHINHEDLTVTIKFDSTEINKDIILTPVHP